MKKEDDIKTPGTDQDIAFTGEIPEVTCVAPRIYKDTYSDGISAEFPGGCFYYDRQLENELTSVSLHPNTVRDKKDITKWNKIPPEYADKSDIDAAKDSGEDKDSYPYRIKPICKAILDEDYQFATSNTFSNSGNDMIGEMFNSFKPYVPYAAHLKKALEEANTKEERMKASGNSAINSTVGQTLDMLTDVLHESVVEMPNLLNRSLVSRQGARFSYYSGTGVGFGNLSMKFTVFSTWVKGFFKSVNDQLSELYDYCFGKFVDFAETKKGSDGSDVTVITGTSIGSNKNSLTGKVMNEGNRYFMWQIPPGGMEANVKDIDKIQKGTLKLKIGVYYSIPNLVIESAQFNFSKQLIKYRNPNDTINNLSPLYCDVSLTLKPVTKFSDVALMKYISGEQMKPEREAVEDELFKRLNEIKDKK